MMFAKRSRVTATLVARTTARVAAACMCVAMLSSSLAAQRPAPPKGWSIDTTGDRPVATRKGGMMTSDSKAELLGPMAWSGTSLADWLRTYAHDDAGKLGVLIPPTGNPVSEFTVSGQRVVVAAYSVNVANSTQYFSYSMPAATATGAPAVVIRSMFGDAMTMVRAMRTSVEAVLPYVITPTPQMRALAVAAAPRAVPTSFRTSPSSQPAAGTQAVVDSAPAADTSVGGAVRAGVTDAITLLGADSATAPTSRRQPASAATVAPLAARTGPISEANLDIVVFYQWSDLQYHPVALFKDGTAFDVDDDAIDAMDVARNRAEHRGRWGRWRRAGPKYVLADGATGRESDWTLGNGFHVAIPAPPATTLTGRYKAVSGSVMGETSTLLTSTMRFLPDGRFTSGTDFAAVGSGAISGVTMAGGASRSAGGRYRIEKYHIELIYDSGQVKRYFFSFGSSGSPARLDRDMLFIGQTAYVSDDP